MPKKSELPMKIAPLLRIVAEPITDPAEIAAIDRFRERNKATRTPRGELRRQPPAKKGR